MASYTPNLNLELPTVNERYDSLKVNSNNEKIDTAFGSLSNQIASGSVPSSANFNNLTNTGVYQASPSGTYTNCPMNGAQGVLIVNHPDSGGTAISQFFITDKNVYVRMAGGGNWSPWMGIAGVSGTNNIAQATITSGFHIYRSGNVVYAACLSGSDYVSDGTTIKVNGTAITIPSGYRPVYGAEVRESLGSQRIVFSNGGEISCADVFTARALRFTLSWITADVFPTT